MKGASRDTQTGGRSQEGSTTMAGWLHFLQFRGATVETLQPLLEDALNPSSDARRPLPFQCVLIQEDPLYSGGLIDSQLVFRTPVVPDITIDAEILENHSVLRQVEIGIPDAGLALVDHGQGMLVPIGDSFSTEYTCNSDLGPTSVSGPLIGLSLMMLFCHARTRAAFLIYVAPRCAAVLSRHGQPVEVSDRMVAHLDALGRSLDHLGSPSLVPLEAQPGIGRLCGSRIADSNPR